MLEAFTLECVFYRKIIFAQQHTHKQEEEKEEDNISLNKHDCEFFTDLRNQSQLKPIFLCGEKTFCLSMLLTMVVMSFFCVAIVYPENEHILFGQPKNGQMARLR